MPYILVQHTIEDYEKWKAVFDETRPVRRDAGSLGGWVFRDAHEPNQVTVLLEWDNLEDAQAFADSPELRQNMQDAGVTGRPSVHFLERADEPAA